MGVRVNDIVRAIGVAIAQALADAGLALPRRGGRARPRGYAIGVTDQITPVAGENEARTKFIFHNPTGSGATIELGGDDLEFGEGLPVEAGGTYIDDVNAFRGEWYAITNVAGPIDARIREES